MQNQKYYLLFETDAEGIRQYRQQSEAALEGTSLSYMRIDGKIVPAIKLYVDKETYINFKREQWREEYHTKQLRKRNDFFQKTRLNNVFVIKKHRTWTDLQPHNTLQTHHSGSQ